MTDTGILARGSVARRLNRESFLLLGGTAALLLQVAHPLVAAGVAQHSGFRREPFGRLLRTLDTTLAVVFGTTAEARAALRRIDRRHVAVHGTAADGRPYAAQDPDLLVWVQVTLVMTSLRLYELVMGPLADAERESYWQEARFFASELGATAGSLPATFADAARYEQDMLSRTVIPDATAREVARDVLHPFRWLPAWASWPLDAVTAGLLPEAPRTAFGLRWRRRERLFFRGVIVALRGSVPLLPERLRFVPQARRYAARAAEAGGVRMD
ncbi:MAG TPA: oxygenase MpaB family protein [Candidatus Limnocylindria bacterium]|nr:oxygenase MpaB family protein [Candidatus Limnocylindria bacterium]